MRQADSLAAFVENPVGSWTLIGTSVSWCASPSLGGMTVWGSPDGPMTRAILEPFDALWASAMDDRVDVVMDARSEAIAREIEDVVSRVSSIDPQLSAVGTSFQRELRDARFTEAARFLSSTDEKVAAIAHRVGVTEGALTQLVRERTGQTPTELRRQRNGSS